MAGREIDYRDIAGELAPLKVDAIVTAGIPPLLPLRAQLRSNDRVLLIVP
jgi:hypothetical protein